MKILKAIDEKTIALHQMLLDKTQLDNNKAIDIATQAICVFALVKAMVRFESGNIIALLILPLTVISAFFLSKMRNALRHAIAARLMILCIALIPLSSTLMLQLIEYAMGACCIMQLYFMACDKPKPPARKTNTAFV